MKTPDIKLHFTLRNETKTCYRFETGEKPDQMTLYLKKRLLDDIGINAHKGVTITVEEEGK